MRDMTKQVDNALLIPTPDRSRHNLDSQTLTTTSFGRIAPIFCQETVPGGNYTLSSEALARFQPLVSPVMHKMTLKMHYFYVPYRLLWDNWENFIMGRKDPLTGLDPVHPYFLRSYLSTATNGKTTPMLADYMGLRPNSAHVVPLNPFAFSAYQMIYNWYYRHKAVKDEVEYKLEDGLISEADFNNIFSVLRTITFDDDYFTSVLPTPQEGDPVFVDADGTLLSAGSPNGIETTNGIEQILEGTPNENDDVQSGLFTRTRILVEEIRRAAKLQQYVEMNNHAKTYIDFLKAQYNVDLQDYRLGIPEYITGFSQPVLVSDVTNMSDNFQGRITGTAASYATSQSKSFYAREHGMILGFAALTYKGAYTNAVPKIHTKTGRFDYFAPIFDNLGEQVVSKLEFDSGHDSPTEPFGYVPRHHEYRSSFDMTTGEARTTLNHYHLAKNYTSAIGLTEDFFDVLDDRRIFAFQDPTFDPVILQVYTNVSAELPMGQVSRPALM